MWNSRDPLLEPEIEDVRWRVVEKQKLSVAAVTKADPTSAKGNVSTKSLKRKISKINESSTIENIKKQL